MIITCSVCSTHYAVDPSALGATGKTVRCANCGNTWNQQPVTAPPPPPPPVYSQGVAPRPAMAQPQPVMPQQFMMQPGMMAQQPTAPGFAAPPPAPEPTPPPAPEPTPPPPPEPAPPPAAEEPSRAIPDGSEEEEKPLPEPEIEEKKEESLSNEQLDTMFGADAEPEPIAELHAVESDDDEFDGVDINDLPEPEPIPEVFVSPGSLPEDEDEEEINLSGSGIAGKIVAVLALLLVGGMVAGFFFAREQIKAVWPGADRIYEFVDGEEEVLGEGLDIRTGTPERKIEGTVDTLIVRGEIVNLTGRPRMVPMIRVTLHDQDGEEVQAVVVAPDLAEILPGERMPFAAPVREPAATARRVEVTFVESDEAKPAE